MNGTMNKKQSALDAGYPMSVAHSTHNLEQAQGVQMAMAQLAGKAGNLALEAMYELEARGFAEFSNSELVKAITAISTAYEKFMPREKPEDPTSNALKELLLKSRAIPVQATPVQTVPANPFDAE